MPNKKRPLNLLVLVAIMGGIALVIQYFDFPLPFFPPFLKIDFSEIPALLTAVIFGPSAGIMVEFIKNLLHFILKGSETGIPIGQLSNFLAGTILILGTTYVYKKFQTKTGLIIGLLVGSVLMTVIMSIANYYFILSFYEMLLHYTTSQAEKLTLVLSGIGPFNLVKGVMITVLFIPIFTTLKPHLRHIK